MCSVEKLLIKGIRSFSPENDHAIVFPKPLTLIVGRNGAGGPLGAFVGTATHSNGHDAGPTKISLFTFSCASATMG